VITDDASWMTASAIAVISKGPPSADATTQRTTSHDEYGEVARAVLRAVPHTIKRIGSSGITPNSRPPIEIGTRCTPSQMLAMAPNAPVMSLFAINNSINVTAAMMTNATTAGPNATRTRSRACRAPAARLSSTRVTLGARVRLGAKTHR
jgi:hypothetical protein